MAYKLFTVSIHNSEPAEDKLNAFLRSHTVLSVERRWVDQGTMSFWSFCVDYLDAGTGGDGGSRRRGKIDYRQVLNDADFALFAKLRDLRKEIAQAEGVPVYAIFNNEQLAKMVQEQARSNSDLEAIAGVGDGRMQKYGPRFLEFLTQESGDGDEADGKPV